jgi:hypothetical protein
MHRWVLGIETSLFSIKQTPDTDSSEWRETGKVSKIIPYDSVVEESFTYWESDTR